MKRNHSFEAFSTGLWLGATQVCLGFVMMCGAGAAIIIYFMGIALWLLGSLIGVVLTPTLYRKRTFPLLVLIIVFDYVVALIIKDQSISPLAVLGYVAQFCTGMYAGIFLRDRIYSWKDVAKVLMHENNGFIAGYLIAAILLLVSTGTLPTVTCAFGAVAFFFTAKNLWEPAN